MYIWEPFLLHVFRHRQSTKKGAVLATVYALPMMPDVLLQQNKRRQRIPPPRMPLKYLWIDQNLNLGYPKDVLSTYLSVSIAVVAIYHCTPV
jgi:hypothetical protein